jgi:hypothetical protein
MIFFSGCSRGRGNLARDPSGARPAGDVLDRILEAFPAQELHDNEQPALFVAEIVTLMILSWTMLPAMRASAGSAALGVRATGLGQDLSATVR